MSQEDFILANAAGAAFRADLNNQLQALASLSSGSSSPSTTYAYQLWMDTSTSPATLKQRNSGNTAWNTIAKLDGSEISFIGGQLMKFGTPLASAPSYGSTDLFRFEGGTGNAYMQLATTAAKKAGYMFSDTALNRAGIEYDHASDVLNIWCAGGIKAVLYSDGGLVLGGATGGSKGAGTLNCKGVYVEGVQLSSGGTYYGNTVFSGSSPASYTDLDLSAVIGSRRCLVMLSVTANNNSNVDFRLNGESLASPTNAAGAAGGALTTGTILYLSTITDSSGIVEWKLSPTANTTVKLLSYIPLA